VPRVKVFRLHKGIISASMDKVFGVCSFQFITASLSITIKTNATVTAVLLHKGKKQIHYFKKTWSRLFSLFRHLVWVNV